MNRERILLFAPHPDDEIIGCGGFLALKRQEGATVRVIIVSDGAAGLPPGLADLPAIRRNESLAGLTMIGVDDVHFWDYPDGAIPLCGEIIEDYRREVLSFRPSILLLPSPGDAHPDHRRVTRGLLGALEGRWQGELRFYETTQPAAGVNTVLDITATLDAKLEALAAHASQLAQFDYISHCRNLAGLRGTTVGCDYGEAFLAFGWDGTRQNFFETRPLVSVIVRADAPEFLRYALASLAMQDYDQIEVILVWFGAEEPDLAAYAVLDLKIVAGEKNRGRNLNLGLAHARGEYVAVLDQDDILLPQHFALLVAEIHGQPDTDIVYSGSRVIACTLSGGHVRADKVVTVMNRPYQPGRLLIGNTAPIHALLFRAQVFRREKFDETLGAYEDWDMLARLELAGYRFAHVDAVTCEYRLFGEGNDSIEHLHRQKNYHPWRNEIIRRIAENLAPCDLEHLATLIDDLEKDASRLEEKTAAADAALAAQREQIAEFTALRDLLDVGLPLAGIEKTGRGGLAELIGRSLPGETLFSIVLPVHNTPPEILSEALFSVANQAYPGWELCLVDDASTRSDTLLVLEQFIETFAPSGKLRFLRREVQGGIVAASNDALRLASAPYVAFLDHDDRLHDEALLAAALALHENPACGLLYSDSRMIDHAGEPLHVYKKPDWSPETLLHLNYINHLTVMRRDLVEAVGGFSAEFDGAQDWDMLLRATDRLAADEIVHLPLPLYDWRATPSSVAYSGAAKPWVFDAARRAVAEHLQRKGFSGIAVEGNPAGPGVVCRWDAALLPVEIIIPTHSNAAGLETCMEGLLAGTDYPQFSITLLANRCESAQMLALLDALAAHPAVRIIADDRPFNWSALNNHAAGLSRAPWLLFLNDDIEITRPDWLANMARYLALDGVGCVGATLLYPNGDMQHNGVRTDPTWIAGNITTLGAKQELAVTRNVSAVTGACLLTPRGYFEQAGGFDTRLAVAYNDIDYCLALRSQGLRIVQPADVTLIHSESATRGSTHNPEQRAQWEKEIGIMKAKWGDFLTERYFSEYLVQAHGTRVLHVM